MILGDLGERRLISEILAPRYQSEINAQFGDDCALIEWGNESGTLVCSTDPCPYPMAWNIGFRDMYYYGWLLSTINMSDLAAMGARPLGLLTSLNLPSTLPISEFVRLLDGIDDCLKTADTRVLGGNLRDDNTIACSATALGRVPSDRVIQRCGASPGDIVVTIGNLGHFWAGYFAFIKEIPLTDAEREQVLQPLLKPVPMVKEGQGISQAGLLTSCMDSSDGLYPCFEHLSQMNQAKFVIDFSGVGFDDVVLKIAHQLRIPPMRLALGWGDWQLVGTTKPEYIPHLQTLLSELGTPLSCIGHVEAGGSDVELLLANQRASMSSFESEKFQPSSTGVSKYADDLLNKPLHRN